MESRSCILTIFPAVLASVAQHTITSPLFQQHTEGKIENAAECLQWPIYVWCHHWLLIALCRMETRNLARRKFYNIFNDVNGFGHRKVNSRKVLIRLFLFSSTSIHQYQFYHWKKWIHHFLLLFPSCRPPKKRLFICHSYFKSPCAFALLICKIKDDFWCCLIKVRQCCTILYTYTYKKHAIFLELHVCL